MLQPIRGMGERAGKGHFSNLRKLGRVI